MKVWKDYSTEDATVVTEKAVKAIKPGTINSRYRKPCPGVVRGLTGFTTEPVKKNHETMDTARKLGRGVGGAG